MVEARRVPGDDLVALFLGHAFEQRRRRRPACDGNGGARMALDKVRQQAGRQHRVTDTVGGDEQNSHANRLSNSAAASRLATLPSLSNALKIHPLKSQRSLSSSKQMVKLPSLVILSKAPLAFPLKVRVSNLLLSVHLKVAGEQSSFLNPCLVPAILPC